MPNYTSLPYSKRICYACNSNKTYVRKNGFQEWICNYALTDTKKRFPLQVLCSMCTQSVLKIEEKKRIMKAYNPKLIYYKTKSIAVNSPPKTGVCNWCRAVYPFDTKLTHMHHEKYHDNDPLKDTIEICISCHRKETIRTRGMQIERDKKGRIVRPIYTRTIY